MGDDNIEDHSYRSTSLRRYHPNNAVFTQPELQATTKRHKLDSPIRDDLSSRRPSPILPNDLIVEILLKLPVKSILQLRCVCKSWKTLISDPQFVNNHLRISTADPTLTHQYLVSSIITQHCKIVSCPVKPLFENPSTPVKPVSVKMSRKYHILGSCNGLLCLYDMYLGCVRLWNPSTRLRSKRSPTVVGTNAIFKYHGFGYDHVNDKYKMLAVVVDDLNVNVDLNESVTKLYTFGDKFWTTIKNFPCNPTSWFGKFVNGTLNWFAKEGVSYNQWVILSFDLVKETYGKLLLPKQDEGGNICNSVLDVLSNCLCVCFDTNKTHWVLWLMKDYGDAESWTKLLIIPHEKIWNCRWVPLFKPLCISNNGVVLVKPLYNLVLFDANNGRLRYRKVCSKLGLDIHVYHESLVSPLLW